MFSPPQRFISFAKTAVNVNNYCSTIAYKPLFNYTNKG